jgi:predicted nucleotide-binding protein (sugar kinase/HSP70/actin superfamily)
MTKAVIPESPPILEIDIDVNKGKYKLYKSIYRLGGYLSWNPLKVRNAAVAAWQRHMDYRDLMFTQGLTAPRAIEKLYSLQLDKKQTSQNSQSQNQITIALVGHPYIIYGEYINHRLIPRLEQANCRVLTPEGITPEKLESATNKLVGRAYWTYEEEVVGAGGHYLESNVDGVIGVMTFGCGPDSVMMEMVRRHALKLRSTPFMSLTIEEHTAVAGIITRLEAFLDMISRRKRGVKTCA